jgi:hypothetical protein
MKITYATLSADNEDLQSAFDAAVERARARASSRRRTISSTAAMVT